MGNRLIIYKPMFKPDAFGHGGEKRSAQVSELLQPLQPQLYGDIRLHHKPSLYKSLKQFVSLLKSVQSADHVPFKNTIGNLRKFYGAFTIISTLRPAVVVLENTTLLDYFVVEAAFFCNVAVCIIPHNIEALVAGQRSPFSGKHSPHWLHEELAMLKRASCVFAISAYDHWLHCCHSINSTMLPYLPPQAAYNKLLQIRKKRQTNGGQNMVLIIGTVKNQPTRRGLQQLVDFLETANSAHQYVLAGYDVEKHFDAAKYNNITIKGTVSDAEMEELQVNCKCLLIQHQPSSGALTRVTEALIAGVPVIGNFFAVKDVAGKTGVAVFESYHQIETILAAGFSVPEIPGNVQQHFINRINQLMHE